MDKNKISKSNYIFMTLEGATFFLGLTFIGENTVIPIFLNSYNVNMQLIGITLTLVAFMKVIPGTLAASSIHSIKNVPLFLRISMLVYRPLMLLMIPVILFIKQKNLVVIIFIVLYLLFFCGHSILNIGWVDIFGRTIDRNKRGKLQGYQVLLGGLGGVAAGYIIKLIFANNSLSQDVKFAIIFGFAGLIEFLSAFIIFPVKDFPEKPVRERVSISSYLSQLPVFIKSNFNFRKILKIQMVSVFSSMAVPFVLLYCSKIHNLSQSQQATLLIFYIVGTMIGGFITGNISHKFGNKNVISYSEGIGVLLWIFVLLNPFFVGFGGLFWLIAFVVFLNGVKSSGWIGYSNYTIDVAEEGKQVTYTVITSLIMLPFYFNSYLAGLIVDKLGFTMLFVIAVITAVTAFLSSLRLKSFK